jgi:quercetin dioxygenase-like cupin family protein
MSNLLKVQKVRYAVAICAGLVLCATGTNASAALIGGVAGAYAGGSPGCQDTKAVPLTTVQNHLALSASAACLGQSATADLYADAATTSVGMKASASGVNFGSQANAFVGLIDRWVFTLPASVATGTILSFPVSFTLDGSVAPGSSYRSSFSSFMNYVFTISDPQQGYSPFQTFQQTGSITTPGVYADTFSGIIKLINRGPGLGMLADVEMNLWIPGLESGLIDFYNTAKISLDLPDGVSVTTSTGLPLSFGKPPVVPEPNSVPEPASWMLVMLGLVGAIGCTRRLNRMDKWMRLTVAWLAVLINLPAMAQEPATAKPQLLLRETVQGMPTSERQEVRVLTASFKPGDKTVFHTHRFPVTVYVLEGVFTLELDGREPISVKAGQALVEPPNVKMTGYNRNTSEPLRVVIFYASDPDTPFLDLTH